MTNEIINNLKELLAAVEAQPEDQFNLDSFRSDEDDDGNLCGTLFCSVGLACTMPKFQDLGYQLVARNKGRWWGGTGSPYIYDAKVGDVDIVNSPVTDAEFGEDAYDNLFIPAGSGDMDADIGYYNNSTHIPASHTDKELAVARLKRRIAEYEAAQ